MLTTENSQVWLIVIGVVALAAVLLIAWLGSRSSHRRHAELKRRFGPEYERAIVEYGSLARAERELASTVVSRINGCVYCGSVHAQRFEQLAKRNDVIAQVFQEPQGAGTNARERAIVQASIELTRSPASFGAAQVQPLRAAGLSALEMLDLVHAVAIFAWANRLMLNLGEPVFPA